MLTVVTLTAGNRNVWLEQCQASVEASLPCDAQHIVRLHTTEDTQELKAEVLTAYPLVAWVDDDDTVAAGALSACVAALQSTGAGVAFTDELLVDTTGQPLPYQSVRTQVRYDDCVLNPRAIHHLVVIRTECIPAEAVELAIRLGTGIDWLTKAGAALCGGAVHVPIFGLNYRQHNTQENRNTNWLKKFSLSVPEISQYLATLHRNRPEYIPTYTGKL